MKAIYQLIRSLTNSQWQTLDKYLTCFLSNKAAQNKSLQLAELLRESEHAHPVNFYSKKLYGKENVGAVERLAQRLRNKILDSLTVDLYCENGNDQDRNSVMRLLRYARNDEY